MASSNVSNPWEGHTRTLNGAEIQEDEDEDAEFSYTGAVGHYSRQMEELFDEEDDSQTGEAEQSSDGDDEDFLYDGIDANTSVSYQDRLREVLGQEDEDEAERAHENGGASPEDDEPLVCGHLSISLSSPHIVTDSNSQTYHS
jgi:hypothetical protein